MTPQFHNFDPWDLIMEICDCLKNTQDQNLRLLQELEQQKHQLATLYLVVDQLRNQVSVINTKKDK